MFSYLLFWLRSTNEHGVHSPFVYSYLTKGIYENKGFKNVDHKSQKWLLKTLHYFKPASLHFLTNYDWQFVRKTYTVDEKSQTEASCLIAHYTPENTENIMAAITNMPSYQFFLIVFPDYSSTFIKELTHEPHITLVLNFYYGCLVSKRTEQLKENFFLRM